MKKSYVIALLCGVLLASGVAYLAPSCSACGETKQQVRLQMAGCSCQKPKPKKDSDTGETQKVAACNCGKTKPKAKTGGEKAA